MYAFVIPAYNPDDKLFEVINNIQNVSNNKIFIIDDGSDQEKQYIFDKLQTKEYCKNIYFLRHAINLGKGAALKTIFNHILVNFPNIDGVVTLDSDGQHSILDCIKVLEELKKNDNALVLGYREFSRDIPLKSYIGNNISKFIYRIILGRSLKDTQTGLRGLSKSFMKRCLSIKSNRFEFETEQLAIATNPKSEINIIEIPIKTIYIENNRASSFRPLVDSFKIYFILFRYGFSSVITGLVDFIVFTIALYFGSNIFSANMISRTFALGVQFVLLDKFVFQTKTTLINFTLFCCYVYAMGAISAWAQISTIESLEITTSSAKIIIETILFFVNFAFLRLYIFTKKGK